MHFLIAWECLILVRTVYGIWTMTSQFSDCASATKVTCDYLSAFSYLVQLLCDSLTLLYELMACFFKFWSSVLLYGNTSLFGLLFHGCFQSVSIKNKVWVHYEMLPTRYDMAMEIMNTHMAACTRPAPNNKTRKWKTDVEKKRPQDWGRS